MRVDILEGQSEEEEEESGRERTRVGETRGGGDESWVDMPGVRGR